MTKSLKIITVSILILAIIGLVVFLFVYQSKDGNTGVDIIKKALPFGKNDESSLSNTSGEQNTPNDMSVKSENSEKVPPKFFQIHKKAVAGAYLFEKTLQGKDSGEIVARYMERGVGHIFETDMSIFQEERISNTTRLKIYEALWGEGGRSVIIRYLDNENAEIIRSFLIKLGKFKDKKSFLEQETITEQTPEETSGVFLPENIRELAVSKNNDKEIFYLINRGGESIGTTYNIETGKSMQIFRSVLTQWLVEWPSKKTITLTTKPSGGVVGILYFLNTDTEKMTRVLGNVKGLTTLTSTDGKKIAYSESNAGKFTLNIYNLENKQSQQLPLATLPEKCVWSKENTNLLYCAVPTNIQSGLYPDIWYQGLTSFSDELWMIDTETFTTNLLLSPSVAIREKMDAIKLQLDPNEDFLIFTNKKDLSLWGLKLK